MARPLLLFAPGAGAPSTSPWMDRWATRLSTLGRVVRFDYPYMREGRKAPDRLPKLILAHRHALAAARTGRGKGARVVLIGKSMGSRVGCHLAAEDGAIDAIVCLGYPLVGQSGAVRDEVLLALSTRILFVQGTRDPLCPLDRLAAVRERMAAESALHVVSGGDHSLELRKSDLGAGRTQDDVDDETLAAIARFVGVEGRRGAR